MIGTYDIYERLLSMKHATRKEKSRYDLNLIKYDFQKKELIATDAKVIFIRSCDLSEWLQEDYFFDASNLLSLATFKKIPYMEFPKIEGKFPDYERAFPAISENISEVKLKYSVIKKALDCLSKNEQKETLNFKFYGEKKPVVFYGLNFRGCIMPVCD